MTLKSRSPSQKANDGAILKKLAANQELAEEEEERLAQLILIALGYKYRRGMKKE